MLPMLVDDGMLVEDGADAKEKKSKVNNKKRRMKRKAVELEEALPIEPVAEKPKLSDNLVLRVGVSQPIDDSARCYKCGSTVERLNARMVGKSKTTWVRKYCNSKGTQLHKIYGSWPPMRIKQMDKKTPKRFSTRASKTFVIASL